MTSDADGPKSFKDFIMVIQLIRIPIFYASIPLSRPDKQNSELTETHHPSILYLYLILFLLAGIVTLKLLLVAWDKCFKPVKFTKCRRDLLIGYGGMIACGIIPQVLKVILMEKWKELFLFSVYSFVCNTLFLFLFVVKHHDKYGTSKKESKKIWAGILRTIMMLLQIAITVIPNSNQSARKDTVQPPQESQVLVTVPTVPRVEEQEETTDGGNSTSGTKCNICTLPYTTTTVIPRMLVGCGHTVCEECIQKIPRQDIQCVLCPFCRKPTSLPDNLPNRLPKNYAILDIIHNLEK
ncbi:hypothetical protein GCK72_011353 [Caenorhabditis remanei]|uniref:RING-type domain-containing protein n=1 Tax=Caenorhabditis remanei TaxID=31234 RepID=A0A6A5H5S7_CAERE|nr:hypothetical protein GCK72_011353 [Caenorhabditis remanei]KAF1763088.1 hypothetical protein GCK72_011353 [Caenorhabditis remanei]